MFFSGPPPLPSSPAGLPLSEADILEHLVIESQVWHGPFETFVFLLEIFHSGKLADLHPSVLAFPVVEGLLVNSDLSTNVLGELTRLNSFKGLHNLCFTEFFSLYLILPCV